MKSGGILKSKDYSDSVQAIEYPLFERNEDLFGSENHRADDNLSMEYATKLYPKLRIMIKESENKAREIIQRAEHKASVIEKEAQRSGYEAGYEAAAEEIHKAIESISTAFKHGIEDLASIKQSILDRSEADIVRLSIEIAKKLVCAELRQCPETIIAIVKKAIELVQDGSEITIRVSPDDYEIIKKNADQLIDSLSEFKSDNHKAPVKIEEDPEILPGGCIVTTDTSVVDMSMDTRLKMLDHLLVDNE